LHASCAGRDDAEFDRGTGYAMVDLEDLPVPVDEETGEVEVRAPVFERDRAGRILATLPNLKQVLLAADWFGYEIGFDDFLGDVMIRRVTNDLSAWRPITDTDCTELRLALEERGFRPITSNLMRDIVAAHADRRHFDSAKQWLSGLEWDQVERVPTFLAAYFGAEDTEYTRAVSNYWWTAHAGRVMEPGCQADMVPILVGEQGVGKTQGVKAMVPSPEQCIEINLDCKDDDLARRMRGALLGEIAELRGLQGRTAEANKAWVTRQWEEWTPKFKEFKIRLLRRLLFVGTTNRDDFLGDSSGERRWLPVRVGTSDPDGIALIRDQLWAEAKVRWAESGIAWQDADRLALRYHREFKSHDIWEDAVSRWIEDNQADGAASENGEQILFMEVVFAQALGKEAGRVTKADEMRMGNVLRLLGYERDRRTVKGRQQRVWIRKKDREDQARPPSLKRQS
ncbi:MAG: VapE domain-containing protein, partial [Erythrobacter sp.]|nr:VapE domain-containing protein [Erythrobacter sp.]